MSLSAGFKGSPTGTPAVIIDCGTGYVSRACTIFIALCICFLMLGSRWTAILNSLFLKEKIIHMCHLQYFCDLISCFGFYYTSVWLILIFSEFVQICVGTLIIKVGSKFLQDRYHTFTYAWRLYNIITMFAVSKWVFWNYSLHTWLFRDSFPLHHNPNQISS